MANIPKKNNPPIIKTPQELVHIKHKITLRQYKLWVLMLRAYRESHVAGETADANGFHHISIKELTEFLGYIPVKAELRSDFESIRQEPIIYNVLDKDGKKIQHGAGFISEWTVSSNYVGYKLPSFLSDSIERLELKDSSSIFLLLNWSVFNSFSGKYEALIYKLCKDYLNVRNTKYMLLQDFREYMGVPATEYLDFKRLNQWVISGPVKKINASEVSDITVEAVLRRENRRVVGLHFIVTSKKQSVIDFGDDPAFRFTRVAIGLPQQKKYLAAYPPELIESSIQRANIYAEELEKKGDPVDLGAIYRTAITQEWGKEYASKLKREKEIQEEKDKAKAKVAASVAKVKTEKAESNADAKVLREQIMNNYLAENEEVQKGIWNRFMLEVGSTTSAAKTKGLDSQVVRKLFEAWLSKQ